MLSQENNDRITRVGRGTPMGDMLRELWTPAVRAVRTASSTASTEPASR